MKPTNSKNVLGILVDSELRFRKQAAAAILKAKHILSIIRMSFELVDAYIFPALEGTGNEWRGSKGELPGSYQLSRICHILKGFEI